MKRPAALAILALAGCSHSTNPNALAPVYKRDVTLGIGKLLDQVAYADKVDFTLWPRFVREARTELDNAETDQDFTNALNRALKKFHISHLQVIPPEEQTLYKAAKSSGPGYYWWTSTEPKYTIVALAPGGPADRAGLKQWDVVTKVDGKPLTRSDSKDAPTTPPTSHPIHYP